jgi:hypothetical protein
MLKRSRLVPIGWALLVWLAVPDYSSPAADAPRGVETGYPHVILSNGTVRLTIYLPDAQKGFYRGARFDWSGMIGRAEMGGHTFFGPFRTPHQPEGSDYVVGPAEEFGMAAPLGYAEARPGETFLKIGIGWLEKIEEPRYRFSYPYTIRQPGIWRIRRGRSWIEFQQEIPTERGWGYRYTKRIALEGRQPAFTLRHTLKNTGTRPVETDQYGHNFILIDDEPVGISYRLRFPFRAPEKQPLKEVAEIDGQELRFLHDLGPSDWLFTVLQGLRGTPADFENRKTGAALRLKGDTAPSEFRFYAARTAACPEPFLALKLAPGEEKRWTVRYDLSVRKGSR